MRKTNIAFSGFMAAILFSAGAANAATQIASRQYVDEHYATKTVVQEIQTDVGALDTAINDPENGLAGKVDSLDDAINNAETGLSAQVQDAVDAADAASTAVDQLGTKVDALETTVGDEAAGLVKDVDDLQVTVGNAESGLVKDVTDLGSTVDGLETTVGELGTELDSKLDSATAATTYEVSTNKATAINAENQTSGTSYPSVGAIVQWTNQKIADLSNTGLPVNPGNIEDGTISGSKLENGAVTTDKIGADAVNGDKIADDSIGAEHIKDGAVGSDAIADGSVTGTDIADGTISADNLDTALNAEIDGKEDKSNKAVAIDSTNQASTDAYPSVKAVYDWTTQQIANVEFDPSTDIADGGLSGDKITDGTITGDKIADDAIDADAIADNAVGTGQIQNGAVTGDKIADGAVDSAAIADGSVTEADLNTDLASKINGKQDRNVGADNSGKILTVGADGNITTSATIAQSAVDGLETALADKADAGDLTTINETIETIEQSVTNITAPDSGLLAQKEDAANKTKAITGENKSSETLFPTIGAITQWTNTEIQKIRDEGIDIGTDNIGEGAVQTVNLGNGAVTTEKIADKAVTDEKLSDELNAEIDGKANAADVYTKLETDGKIVEIAIPRPTADCQAESGLCVLSVTTGGDLAWVNVTEPAGDSE